MCIYALHACVYMYMCTTDSQQAPTGWRSCREGENGGLGVTTATTQESKQHTQHSQAPYATSHYTYAEESRMRTHTHTHARKHAHTRTHNLPICVYAFHTCVYMYMCTTDSKQTPTGWRSCREGENGGLGVTTATTQESKQHTQHSQTPCATSLYVCRRRTHAHAHAHTTPRHGHDMV